MSIEHDLEQLQTYNSGPRFKVEGSDLEFRYVPFTPERLWKKARCVTPGKTAEGFDHNKITIVTQGTHAISPHLDLPYFCYVEGDAYDDFYSVFSRRAVSPSMLKPVIDVRNPWKPKRVTLASIQASLGSNEDNLIHSETLRKSFFTRYGELDYVVYEATQRKCYGIYIPKFSVIANAFETEQGKLELQCMFNVGNSFSQQLSFPTKTAFGYIARPIVSLVIGEFTEQGLWVNSAPSFAGSEQENLLATFPFSINPSE